LPSFSYQNDPKIWQNWKGWQWIGYRSHCKWGGRKQIQKVKEEWTNDHERNKALIKVI